MIIKSISVKSVSLKVIAGILDYVASDKGLIQDQRHAVYHNLTTSQLDLMALDFQRNFKEFSSTKNRTPIRHIILAVNPKDRHLMTHAIMDNLMKEYLNHTFPEAIAFGMQHTSDKWHGHLVVSGNLLMSKVSTRQSKAQLYQSHMHMLAYMREKYPQLTIGIDLDNYGRKMHSEKAYYKEKRNPQLVLTRTELSEKVQGLFRLSENTKNFKHRLEAFGLRTYEHKGRLQGVLWDVEGKKMRFSRLGIHERNLAELDVQSERLKELENFRAETAQRKQERDGIERFSDR